MFHAARLSWAIAHSRRSRYCAVDRNPRLAPSRHLRLVPTWLRQVFVAPLRLKRHPALEQLSRDHHHALVVAQRLKRADNLTAGEARDDFVAYWGSDGREHFREEEEILLPACAGFVDAELPIIAKVLTDHVRIRHLANAAVGADSLSVAMLHELGGELERHVRREERELFPLIEQSMPDAELRRLVALLTR